MRVTFRANEMYIQTTCINVDQVVTLLTRFFIGDASVFIATLNRAPQGMDTPFRILLKTGTIVLRGQGTIRKVWVTAESPWGLPGLLLAVQRLTQHSAMTFERIRGAPTKTAKGTVAPPLRSGCATKPEADSEIPRPVRTNPVSAETEAAIASFVEDALVPWQPKQGGRS